MKSFIACSFNRLFLIACLIILFGCEEGLEPLDEGRDIPPLSNTILDRDYVKRLCFYLENPGTTFDPNEPGFDPSFLTTHIDILPETEPIEVYVSLRTDLNEGQTYEGSIFHIEAYADPENNGLGDNAGVDSVWTGIFKKLVWLEDFNIIRDFEDGTCIGIWLFQPLDDRRALAVCYKATDGTNEFDVGDYDTYKGVEEADPRLAELICPQLDEFGPDSWTSFYPSTWKMMMRNIYELGIGDVDPGIVNIRIEDRSLRPNRHAVPDPSGVSYLRIFGLDRYDEHGEELKDGRIDLGAGILYPELGFLKFPWPEPFNPPRWVIESILDPSDPKESLFDYDELVRNYILYDTLLWSEIDDSAHAYSIIVEWPSVEIKDQPEH